MMKKILTYERFAAMSGAVNGAGQARFLKFMAIGVLNTANGYFLFAALLYSGLHYSLATLLANILSVFINFKTYGRIVFNSRDNGLIYRFISIYVFMYFLIIGCLKVFTLLSINLYVGNLLLTIPLAIVSFFLNSRFVFRVNVNKLCR